MDKFSKIFNPRICGLISKIFFYGDLRAPGTWGSFIGAIFCIYVMRWLPIWLYAIVTVILVLLAIKICDVAEKYFNSKDPGLIILDEFVAMPICYFTLMPFPESIGLWGYVYGFVIFRFFDIFKPFGISSIQKLKGGLGCVADDVLAAIYTSIILNLTIIYIWTL